MTSRVKKGIYFLKIFVIFLCVIELLVQLFLLIATEFRLLDYIGLFLDLMLLLALVGFVWQKIFFVPLIWKGVLSVIIFWQLFFVDFSLFEKSINIGVISGNAISTPFLIFVVTVLFLVQLLKLMALFLYAFNIDLKKVFLY